MTTAIEERRQRVLLLLDAARILADPATPLGQRARQELPQETGLSPQNVALCLEQHLETKVAAADLDALLAKTTPCRKAHVLLSANVFTAPLRAISLAASQSARVDVRPSRRQPLFTQLLWEASGGAFRVVKELGPAPEDHVWAYGRDESLEAVRDEMPAGVVFHGHASGFGVAAVASDSGESVSKVATALVRDVFPFDQRGCLSPRIVLVRATAAWARELCQEVVRALSAANHDVPLGTLSEDEAAELTRYRDTMTYTGELLHAGKSVIGFDERGNVLLPPVGRNLHLTCVEDFGSALGSVTSHVTSVGAPSALHAEFAQLLPRARIALLGEQQRPPLDGPVDKRPVAEVL